MKPRRTMEPRRSLQERDTAHCCSLDIRGCCCCSTSRLSFTEGDEERGEGRAGYVRAFILYTSHRSLPPRCESDGRCSPPTSTIILAAQCGLKILSFFSPFESGTLGLTYLYLHGYPLGNCPCYPTWIITCGLLLIRSPLMVCLTSSSWPRPRYQTPAARKDVSFWATDASRLP